MPIQIQRWNRAECKKVDVRVWLLGWGGNGGCRSNFGWGGSSTWIGGPPFVGATATPPHSLQPHSAPPIRPPANPAKNVSQ
jgi:hypothetical protein